MELPASLAAQLALDEALLIEAEEGGGESLRFWEWDARVVVVGAGGRIAEEVDQDACRADRVPILRRSSGGGAVLLGPGCLLFSLVLSFERDPLLAQLASSYRYILERLARALDCFAAGIVHAGTSDLAWNDLKVSGNSQQRKRGHLLHHGTLLYAFDPAPLPRYLRMPPRQPDYRRERGHVDFVANIPASRVQLEEALKAEWDVPLPAEIERHGRLAALVAEKYGNEEWVRRR